MSFIRKFSSRRKSKRHSALIAETKPTSDSATTNGAIHSGINLEKSAKPEPVSLPNQNEEVQSTTTNKPQLPHKPETQFPSQSEKIEPSNLAIVHDAVTTKSEGAKDNFDTAREELKLANGHPDAVNEHVNEDSKITSEASRTAPGTSAESIQEDSEIPSETSDIAQTSTEPESAPLDAAKFKPATATEKPELTKDKSVTPTAPRTAYPIQGPWVKLPPQPAPPQPEKPIEEDKEQEGSTESPKNASSGNKTGRYPIQAPWVKLPPVQENDEIDVYGSAKSNSHSSSGSSPSDSTSDTTLAAVQRTADQSAITGANESANQLEAKKFGTIGDSLRKTTLLSRQTDYNPTGNVDPPPKAVNDIDIATREDIENTFEHFAHVIHAPNKPLPSQTGQGPYLATHEPTGLLADIKTLGLKELNTVRRILEQRRSGEPQDDRKYLMEAVIQLAAGLPDRSRHRVEITGQFLDELWNNLPHPPLSYLGDNFKYRSADGSRNNPIHPMLGAANTPYARSVNPATVTPAAKPDPFLVFDSLMARQEFKENPNRVSSVFFNWASVVIHDLFQTDHTDPSISKTSSYLDLSVLYGDNQEDQNTMRTFKDGMIKPDCFAEERLLAFPPTAGVLIIMLNRYHNYVVEQLALINENGRFTKPSDDLPEERKEAAWKKYDEDLFQTGRLITCGLYINITLYDYLRTIVNLNRVNSTWTLDPRMEIPRNLSHNGGSPRGVGNQVSAEFALCYRWHAAIGQLDEAWTEEVYQELFGKDPKEVDLKELMLGLAKYDHELPEDPLERPFAHLERGTDGKFSDEDLATIMVNAVEQVSGAFDARNTPKSMRAITALGIIQGRQWNMCTLNEFRAFFGLKRFETFEEVNSDPYVQQQLKNLYEHPDYIELYPGIAIEEAKSPMVPGVGICPNHTLARAVLSDAVALVRGDRFYTLDYNPKNLTNWGYNECSYDLSVNQGCVMHKLFLRAFPNHFKPDSIYAHYPMTVPDENAKIMKDLGRFHDYNWEKPTYIGPRLTLTSHPNVKHVLDRPRNFNIMWNDLGIEMGFSGDSVFNKKQRETMQAYIYREKGREQIKYFYQYITRRLIAEKSVKIATINQVDIVRDVGNLAQVHFIANMFALSLKTEESPKGIFTDDELWMAMSVIFTAIFFDLEPSKSYALRQVARKFTTWIGNYIELNINSANTSAFTSMFYSNHSENPLVEKGRQMMRKLSAKMSAHEIAFSQILPTAIATVPNQSQAFAQVIDYYLGEGNVHWSEIQKLAATDNAETDEKLLHYVLEGIRLNGTFGSYRRAQVEYRCEEDGEQVRIQPGDRVFCSFFAASRDSSIFQNPNEVDLDRPIGSYIHNSMCDYTCFGREASHIALTAMLRTVARIPDLRRAPGDQGQLKKVLRPGGFYEYMTERHDSFFAFPTTMKVHFDGVIPKAPQSMWRP